MNSKTLQKSLLSLAIVGIFILSAFSAVSLSSSATTASPSFVAAYNLSNDGGKAQEPNVQSSGSNVYVTWTEGSRGILFRASPNNGTTWTPALTSTALKLSTKGGTTQAPLMAAFGSDVYVVWAQTSGAENNLQVYIAVSKNSGETFSAATQVAPMPDTPEITPVIAAYGSTVYVAWSANGTSVLTSSTNYGSAFSAPFTFSNIHEPQLAAFGSSGYAVADGGSLFT